MITDIMWCLNERAESNTFHIPLHLCAGRELQGIPKVVNQSFLMQKTGDSAGSRSINVLLSNEFIEVFASKS